MQEPSLRLANDGWALHLYNRGVSKTRPPRYTNWFLREWLKSVGMSQATLGDKIDLNKTSVSHLVNNQVDYTPEYVRDVAAALNIAPYELFLHPDDAAALRRLMTDAENAAELNKRIRLVSDRTGTDG